MSKEDKREAFQDMCYGREPKVWDNQWICFDGGITSKHQNNICRYCKQEIKEEDFCITYGYWYPLWYPSHKDCKQEGENNEAFECQKIDSACNDCKYFNRDTEKSGKIVFYGICSKKNKEVRTSRCFCENRDCFVHRNLNKQKEDKNGKKIQNDERSSRSHSYA